MGRSERAFGAVVAALGALGLLVRLIYVVAFRADAMPGGDDLVYHTQALLVADGWGWTSPLDFDLTGVAKPQADHPPLTVAYLAAVSVVGFESRGAHLVAIALAGSATVVVVALLARRLGGDRAGWWAGLFAAAYPGLWAWDGRTLSEGPSALAATAAVLAGVRALERPSAARVTVLAGSATLAGLARAELILLVPLLVIPVLWRAGSVARAVRVGLLATLVTVALVGPWAVYNTARFEHPVVLSTGLGRAMASGDCDAGFRGELAGYWDLTCLEPVFAANPGLDESEYERLWRADALAYVGGHLDEVPVVLAMRWGRTFALYRPLQQLDFDQFAEGKEAPVAGAAMTGFWLLAASAVAGGWSIRRRRAELWMLVSPIGCVLVATALAFGSARYRAPAEGVVVVLAALGVERLIRSTGVSRRLPAWTPVAVVAVWSAALGVGAVIGWAHTSAT